MLENSLESVSISTAPETTIINVDDSVWFVYCLIGLHFRDADIRNVHDVSDACFVPDDCIVPWCDVHDVTIITLSLMSS